MTKIRIGTRGSRLALAQAEEAARALQRKGFCTEITVVRTRGDVNISSSLAEIGKGAFTDVFSEMIARGELDLAVHSAKDLPAGEEKDGFFCLPRANARDVLLSVGGRDSFRVGTGSPRRAAAVRRLFACAEVLPVRGNVDTRIAKMLSGEYDALVLAAAGLLRLGILAEDDKEILLKEKADEGRQPFGRGAKAGEAGNMEVRLLSPEECVPAACQGIIALEGEVGREINDAAAQRAAKTERALQRALGGDCTGGAGAYFDGQRLFAQRDGRIEIAVYEGTESVVRLAERFR